MAAMTTSSFAKALWPGVRKFFGAKYKAYPKQYTQIFEQLTSTMAFEEEVGVTGYGLPSEKTEGAAITYDEMEQGFTKRYTHVTYGNGFVVTREMAEDNLAPSISLRRATALSFSANSGKEIVHANVLNRAFNSSYTGADGLELCSTLHVNKSGGTQRNELSTASDLSEAAIEQALIDIADITNDRGLTISMQSVALVIPQELRFEAHRFLNASLRPASADNDPNAIKDMGMFSKGIITNNFLTDPDAWFILTDCPDGLKTFQRRKPEFVVDNEFDTENLKAKFTERYSTGWTDWRQIFGSPGA